MGSGEEEGIANEEQLESLYTNQGQRLSIMNQISSGSGHHTLTKEPEVDQTAGQYEQMK
jgi:hypothetical protein